MARIGISATTGYSWNDDDPDRCYQINDSTGYKECSLINTCSECLRSESCDYSDYTCSDSSMVTYSTPKQLFED